MQSVVAMGYESAVVDLMTELRRRRHHGLTVVDVCLAQPSASSQVARAPVYGGLGDVTAAVYGSGTDTVRVLACPEMDATKLRGLPWELEKTDTDLLVAPALLDVAGPRTAIRPTASLALPHVAQPHLDDARLVLRGLFDRCAAALVLILLAPVLTEGSNS